MLQVVLVWVTELNSTYYWCLLEKLCGVSYGKSGRYRVVKAGLVNQSNGYHSILKDISFRVISTHLINR